jgi:hypothetical protein
MIEGSGDGSGCGSGRPQRIRTLRIRIRIRIRNTDFCVTTGSSQLPVNNVPSHPYFLIARFPYTTTPYRPPPPGKRISTVVEIMLPSLIHFIQRFLFFLPEVLTFLLILLFLPIFVCFSSS